MASENENSHVAGLVELEELEVMEIDEALLREVLEEQVKVGAEEGEECLVESVESGDKMKEEKEEVHKQDGSYSEQHEGSKVVNNGIMEIVEPASQNEVILNWYPDDDTIGMMTDFGFANGELCSQFSEEGLVSYEAYYGCFWEDL